MRRGSCSLRSHTRVPDTKKQPPPQGPAEVIPVHHKEATGTRHLVAQYSTIADTTCTSERAAVHPDLMTRLNAICEAFCVKLEDRARRLKASMRSTSKKPKQPLRK
ncbi:Hypothetical predicted protein [Pelobates cultripes]|uniref:Uncharacterized protein n=1 Tax=Pelobates cultripes TaxID=61616 RepID=A0AAD1WAY9_PELCU|nr:Hypothetical predicted protein [Pelobates cultripes]